MAQVYRALDVRVGRPVALKVLSPLRSRTHDRERFLRESRTASLLNHPNLMTVYEAGEVAGQLFLAAELIEGETLATRLRRGPQPAARAVEVARQLLQGLQAAHEAGVVHRDVKPQNVMIRVDGVVKLLDFGLAKSQRELEKLTQTGALLGTPHYMAPEQLGEGAGVDPRSDLFALGAVLYEMLTGRQAFTGQTFSEVAQAILTREPDLEALPASLRPVVERALAKDPAQRYPSARSMQEALTGVKLPPPTREARILLILPLGGNELPEAQADGLTWGLISRLQMQGLAVIGRRRPEERGLAEHLGAQLVLEGTLNRQAGRLRADLALLEVSSGQQLWARGIEPRSADPFDLEEELARAIVPALTTWLGAETPEPQPGSLAPELQGLYHRALHLLLQEGSNQSLREAEQALRELLEQAPHFAPARARLASATEQLVHLTPLAQRAPLITEARGQAVEALALDPTQLAAYLTLARLSCAYPDYDWEEARTFLKQARALAPEHPVVLSQLAIAETVLGHAERVVKLARQAVRHDPQSVLGYVALTLVLSACGQPREAADAAERCLRIEPSCQFASAALLVLDYVLGAPERALEYYRRLDGPGRDGWHPVLRAAMLLFQGLVVEPERPLSDLLPGAQDTVWFEIHALRLLVSLAGGRGDAEKALELLEALLSLNYRNLSGLEHDPLLDTIRQEPRFQAICQDLRDLIAQDS